MYCMSTYTFPRHSLVQCCFRLRLSNFHPNSSFSKPSFYTQSLPYKPPVLHRFSLRSRKWDTVRYMKGNGSLWTHFYVKSRKPYTLKIINLHYIHLYTEFRLRRSGPMTPMSPLLWTDLPWNQKVGIGESTLCTRSIPIH